MIPRKFTRRKTILAIEPLERKELMSAGFSMRGVVPPAIVSPLVNPRPQTADIRPCGTGKGIVIITS
jgi:hypothetical protein